MADGVMIIRALLLAYAPVAVLVADRVYAGDVPQTAALPAIGIREISRIEADTAARDGANTLVTARIQVTVHGGAYPQQKALLLATKLGEGVHTGVIAGAEVRSVLRDAVGPDLSVPDAGVFQQSRDFKVTYLEPN